MKIITIFLEWGIRHARLAPLPAGSTNQPTNQYNERHDRIPRMHGAGRASHPACLRLRQNGNRGLLCAGIPTLIPTNQPTNPEPAPKMKKRMITIHTLNWSAYHGAWTEGRVTLFRPASQAVPTVRGAARMLAAEFDDKPSDHTVVRVESRMFA